MAVFEGRSCVFCGSPANSREHVWPRWVSAAFATELELGELPFLITDAAGQHRRAKVLDTQIRQVCSPCNNGWMSDIEQAAQPLLLPLMLASRGEYPLSAEAQRALATWAALKAMMFNLVRPEGAPVPEWAYRGLRTDRCPSAERTAVWMSCYKGRELAARGHSRLLPAEDRQVAGGYLCTLHVGRVVFQVLENFSSIRPKLQDERAGFVLIWPASPIGSGVVWPDQQLAFDDEELAKLDPTVVIEQDGHAPLRLDPPAVPNRPRVRPSGSASTRMRPS